MLHLLLLLLLSSKFEWLVWRESQLERRYACKNAGSSKGNAVVLGRWQALGADLCQPAASRV